MLTITPLMWWFLARVAKRVPLVEQELITLQGHLSSPPVFGGVQVALSLVCLYVLYPFGHCIVCPLSFWPLYCLSFILLTIVLSVLYPFGHCIFCPLSFWPLYCLSFYDVHLLIISLVSFGHCIVCPFSMYIFWLSLWYLQTFLVCQTPIIFIFMN